MSLIILRMVLFVEVFSFENIFFTVEEKKLFQIIRNNRRIDIDFMSYLVYFWLVHTEISTSCKKLGTVSKLCFPWHLVYNVHFLSSFHTDIQSLCF